MTDCLKLARALPVVLALIACYSMPGCLESSFRLAPDSRLPKWFVVPKGVSRADVMVTQDNYELIWSSPSIFKFWDAAGHKLDEVTAVVEGSGPRTLTKTGSVELSRLSGPLYDYKSLYPLYEIISARGVTEIIEYRELNNAFRLNDDPVVRAKLGLQGGTKPPAPSQ